MIAAAQVARQALAIGAEGGKADGGNISIAVDDANISSSARTFARGAGKGVGDFLNKSHLAGARPHWACGHTCKQ